MGSSGPKTKVISCLFHTLNVSGILSQVIHSSRHQMLRCYNIHATCLQVFRERGTSGWKSWEKPQLKVWVHTSREHPCILGQDLWSHSFQFFPQWSHIHVKCMIRLCKASKYFPQGLAFGPPAGFTNSTKLSVSPILAGFLPYLVGVSNEHFNVIWSWENGFSCHNNPSGVC